MTWIDLIGWTAALLTFSAHAMRTMLPLRCLAVGANVFFILFGWFEGLFPILALHAALLPFNLLRLWQLLTGLRDMRAAGEAQMDFSWLRDLARPVTYKAGSSLFRMGDPPTYLYLIDSGEILIDEIGVTLTAGEIVGEIAFFTEEKARTASATCVTDCRVFPVDEARFLALYHQNPAFSLMLTKMITRRLRDRLSQPVDEGT